MQSLEYVENLEKLFEESFKVPLSSGKVVVDAALMQDTIDNLKESLPNEFKQAEAIVQDRNRIVTEARREADTIMHNAQEKAKYIVSRDPIVQEATKQGNEIIAKSKQEARDLEDSAKQRATDGLNAARAEADRILNDARIKAESMVTEATARSNELRAKAEDYANATVDNANNAAANLKNQTEEAAAKLANATNEYSNQLLAQMYDILSTAATDIKTTHSNIKTNFEMKVIPISPNDR